MQSHPHKQYGMATLIRNDIPGVKSMHKSSESDVELLGIDINGLNTLNVYKPPNHRWPTDLIPIFNEATAYIGDFNSQFNSPSPSRSS